MAESTHDRQVFTLLQVTRSIQKTLSERYSSSFWVKAEMNKLNYYSHSGHCYPELVEKVDGRVIAQMKSNLWKSDYQRINDQFQKILNEPLKDGIKILFQAKVSFDPVYGISLQILDIDPSYTLGDLEKEKQETISRLKSEGLFLKNKSLPFPVLPQRLAIISVETSKGYADFLQVLESNPWGYAFFHMLFPALLQGEKAIDSILSQLHRIHKVKEHFDVVAIIRGGGGDVGLSCYNHYDLARAIAEFPIPVITGIGHATNETVSEMIAYMNGITPTKVAEDLIQKFHNFARPVEDARNTIAEKSNRLLQENKNRLQQSTNLFRHVTEKILQDNQHQIHQLAQTLSQQSSFLFRQKRDYLAAAGAIIQRGSVFHLSQSRLAVRQLAADMRKDAHSKIQLSAMNLDQWANEMQLHSTHFSKKEKQQIGRVLDQLRDKSERLLRNAEHQLKLSENSVQQMSPENVLRRGYSITLHEGKVVRHFADVKPGDKLDTRIFEGNIESTVDASKKQEET